MLGGESIASDNFANIVHDITLLNSLGIKLVLVAGSRPQIEDRLRARGLTPRLHHHRRVTDDKTLECVIEAAASVRTQLEAKLSLGLTNTPMHGAKIRVVSGNFVTARPVGVDDGVDLRHTGEVRRIDTAAINRYLNGGDIVLIPHLGYSPTGEIFNVAVEDVATCAASALNADKLILFGADKGVTDKHGSLRSEIITCKAEELVSQHFASLTNSQSRHAEIARHLNAAVTACHNGIERCHLVSYQEDGALITELFTREGSGTMVLKESYEQIRPANIEDVGGLLELIRPLEEQGTLVRRSREKLEEEIGRFMVVERDGAIIGCAALYPFEDEACGELACVVMSDVYRGSNKGDMLLAAIEAHALKLGLSTLFVLTTRTAHWFIERGFKPAALETLPNEKRELYNYQRNSKVFSKPL